MQLLGVISLFTVPAGLPVGHAEAQCRTSWLTVYTNAWIPVMARPKIRPVQCCQPCSIKDNHPSL